MHYLFFFRNADLQHLSVLELSDSTTSTSNRSGYMNLHNIKTQVMTDDENADCSLLLFLSLVLNPQTVVELFYQNVARKAIMSQMFSQQDVEGNETMLHWPQMISSVLTLLCQFLYP